MNFDSLRFYICKTPLDLKMSDVNTSGNWRAEAAGETQLRTFNVPHNQEVKQEARKDFLPYTSSSHWNLVPCREEPAALTVPLCETFNCRH